MTPQTDGAALIAAERQRQISEEGWTPENDDQHTCGELAFAAAAYALSATGSISERPVSSDIRRFWPWSYDWLKPKSPIRDLTRAGALIAAEIDRLQRLEQPTTQTP